MVALVAMGYEWRMRNRVGVIVASIAGLVLQFLGLNYDVEGDTMGMLVAVLDTNFWLSTHVTCMTTGYATCILGSIMAHVYLVMRMVKPDDKERLAELSRNIRGISYMALLFTSVGTILGGIWADQSWGRFWGWDPKENGALLIVLWLLFITHGRMAGRLKELGFNIGMAMTSITVALAWFGVNLLAIGLHSYGFTQGAATGLASFVSGELIFAATSYMVISKWQRKISS
jgi:ABC-type transport system involved in cytochrome c biogenesis permease subunit